MPEASVQGSILQRVGEGLPQPMLAVVSSTTAQKQNSTNPNAVSPHPSPLPEGEGTLRLIPFVRTKGFPAPGFALPPPSLDPRKGERECLSWSFRAAEFYPCRR